MASRKSFRIPKMCCENCVALVRRALDELTGLQSVDLVLERKTVTVTWDNPATWQAIERQLDRAGYPPGPPFA